jgi:NAD(P)-dependent dehydrogenase (short-subunit alcohol dehydrogenase family)
MDLQLAGTTVLVTGAGQGLGRAIGEAFAAEGAQVAFGHHTSGEGAEQAAEAARAAGVKAIAVGLDTRDDASVARALDAVESELGPIGVLVNNAAANFPVAAANLSANGWRAVTSIVLDGTFFCSQELHRRCRRDGRTGSIVNIAATQAFTGGPGMAHSAAAKAGVVSLTKTLAVEWAPDGVRVNAIAPGLFPHEDMPAEIRAARDERLDAARQPAGRVGAPHELGWAATWLCSPYASFVTGHVLVVDGGNWLRRDFAMPPFRPIDEQLPRHA